MNIERMSLIMKKKKRNYYNLIVYIFRVVTIVCLVFGILFSLGNMKIILILKKYEALFFILTCILAIVMIILLALIKKYEQKITIDIDFPQKPFAYEIINIENIEKGISKQLLQLEYTKNLHQIASLDIYYNSKNIRWDLGQKKQLNIFCQMKFAEFTKNTKKELLLKREEIFNKLYKQAKFVEIIFLVKIPKRNKYLERYLKEVIREFPHNYFLVAVLVEEERKMYIPHSDFAYLEYREMRKRLEKILSGHIKKIKKLR